MCKYNEQTNAHLIDSLIIQYMLGSHSDISTQIIYTTT